MPRNVFCDLVEEPRLWIAAANEVSEPMEDLLTDEQRGDFTSRLASIETLLRVNEVLLKVNTDSTKRLEVRLLGEDGRPESGIIAMHDTRIRKLEDEKWRERGFCAAAVVAWQIFGHKFLALVGL